MWETGFDRRQVRRWVRQCVVNALTAWRFVDGPVCSLASRSSPAAFAAAVVHSSNSHCLTHTSFDTPHIHPGYRGSTTVATTTTYRRWSVTARQSRHQKASRRRRHATCWVVQLISPNASRCHRFNKESDRGEMGRGQLASALSRPRRPHFVLTICQCEPSTCFTRGVRLLLIIIAPRIDGDRIRRYVSAVNEYSPIYDIGLSL